MVKNTKGLFSRVEKKFVIGSVIVLAITAFLDWGLSPSSIAASVLWSSGVPTTISTSDAPTNWKDPCQAKFHTSPQIVAISNGASTDCSLGTQGTTKLFTYNYQRGVAAQSAADTTAFPIGINCLDCVYLPTTDTFITIESNNDIQSGRIAIYDNFTSRLHFDAISQYYAFDSSSPRLISNYFNQSGYVGYFKHLQRSSNDKYLFAEGVGTGLFRIDMSNLQLLKFSNLQTSYTSGVDPVFETDLADDGQHIAVFGVNSPLAIYDVTSSCGSLLPLTPTEDGVTSPVQVQCPLISVQAPLGDITNTNAYMPNLKSAYQPRFNSDGTLITFYATSNNTTAAPRIITLQAANYIPPTPSPTSTPPPAYPSAKAQCMDGGWKNFGGKFKNQGDCVSFTVNGK